MQQDQVLLLGAGPMAIAYAHVLAALDRPTTVIGRGADSAHAFERATGLRAGTGTLDEQLIRLDPVCDTAIVAVNAMYLTDVTTTLIESGVRRLLVEKPAGLDRTELDTLVTAATEADAEVVVGYNRRFVESVRVARSMVEADGGPVSVKFDFSEPSRRIATLGKPQRELDTWFYGNSSHVVDLALHFSGDLINPVATTAGSVGWHPGAGVFVGHAESASGALVSWHANWVAPGRWGLEVMTRERRLILQPLEQLRVQTHDGFAETPVELDDDADRNFKPGLLRQVRAFLDRDESEHLCGLADHQVRFSDFEMVRTGAAEGAVK